MNDEKTIFVPAILGSVSFAKDGGLRVGFQTQELTPTEKMALSSLYGKFGWLAFKENHISVSDIPTEDAEDRSKTPSKRLRNVLYVLSQQKGVKDFEPWYREKMELIIERIKNELD